MIEPLTLALGALLLAAPAACPPQEGQIRFDGLVVKVRGQGGEYQLTGALWDRDTNDAPSKGDLFRVDEILRNGRSTGAEAVWFVLGPELASVFAPPFRKDRETLRTACESRVQVGKEIPNFKGAEALTKFLSAHTNAEPVAPAPDEELRAQMTTWADEICKQGKHVPEAALQTQLVTRAGKTGLARNVVQGISKEVAAKFAFACTRVEGKFTYE
ncbi:MAG: hypothetical protein ACOYM9_15215 [Bradymonadia bacterium]|jgi:hypothetical protein